MLVNTVDWHSRTGPQLEYVSVYTHNTILFTNGYSLLPIGIRKNIFHDYSSLLDNRSMRPILGALTIILP